MRGMECSESGPCLESHRQRAGSWKMEADSLASIQMWGIWLERREVAIPV